MFISNICFVNRKLLADNPPAKFNQDYYTCHPDTLSTLQAAVGVAAGNMSVTAPIVLAILLPLAFFFLKWLDKIPLQDIYSKEDEEAALQVVAGMMLRLRDRRAAGLDPEGTLATWYSELAESAQTCLYYELMQHPMDHQKESDDVIPADRVVGGDVVEGSDDMAA